VKFWGYGGEKFIGVVENWEGGLGWREVWRGDAELSSVIGVGTSG
jgi:hypothetical protein